MPTASHTELKELRKPASPALIGLDWIIGDPGISSAPLVGSGDAEHAPRALRSSKAGQK